MSREVVIVGAVRTAIGKFGGALAQIPAAELGARVIADSLRRAEVAPDDLNEVIMGCVIQGGAGPNVARQASLRAGLPHSLPAFTVNKLCASGMKAVTLGAASVAAGENDVVVVGGVENMSAAPYYLMKGRWGYRLGHEQLVDSVLHDGLLDPLECCHMGNTAENLAEEFSISRQEQDEFAARSQQKAVDAIKAGRFKKEIVPIEIPQRKGEPVTVDTDEGPREGATAEKLAGLKPAFQKDGSVTPGNSSTLNDGAAAMILMSADEAKRRGLTPQAKILGYGKAAVEPSRMGYGPVPATHNALKATGLKFSDLEAIELNEAFAAQALAVLKNWDVDPAIVNMNGGAIALGHPVGMSGARILITLINIMEDKGLKRGLATLCVGGGQGMATIIERV